MGPRPPAEYKKYHLDRNDERLELFVGLAREFGLGRVLYPGSYVHFTPSFVFPDVVYVDTMKAAAEVFADPRTLAYIKFRKRYAQEPNLTFHYADYRRPLPEAPESFDFLLSLWAGFVAKHCGKYLRAGGVMLANNSHGNAGWAALDPSFELVAVVRRRSGEFSFSTEQLESYFEPKRPGERITKECLERLGRGVAYTKSATAYAFRKRKPGAGQ
ncbi:MAG: hypothetical protein Kow0069_35320 [Promethearchaeota archaeon]